VWTGWQLAAEDVQLIDEAFPLPPRNEPLDML
jgi:hypothetical protein